MRLVDRVPVVAPHAVWRLKENTAAPMVIRKARPADTTVPQVLVAPAYLAERRAVHIGLRELPRFLEPVAPWTTVEPPHAPAENEPHLERLGELPSELANRVDAQIWPSPEEVEANPVGVHPTRVR